MKRIAVIVSGILIVVFALLYKKEYPKKIEWNDSQIVRLSRLCNELAECMKGSSSIVSQNGYHRFMCLIKDKSNLSRGTYFRPIVMEGAWHDRFSEYFKQHIVACQMSTRTGDYSDEAIAAEKALMERSMKRMEQNKIDREKAQQDRVDHIKRNKELLDSVVRE